jgi:hypothetical protein
LCSAAAKPDKVLSPSKFFGREVRPNVFFISAPRLPIIAQKAGYLAKALKDLKPSIASNVNPSRRGRTESVFRVLVKAYFVSYEGPCNMYLLNFE